MPFDLTALPRADYERTVRASRALPAAPLHSSGAAKAHDWMVKELGPLFQTAGHKVKTTRITPSSGSKRGDLEIVEYLRDAAGSRHLIIDLSITHDRIGSSQANPQANGALSHPNALDTPLTLAATRKINKYQATYANTHGISFMPAITSTSTRMHGEFLRLLFFQAHRETAAYFTFMGVPVQPTNTDMFRFRRAAFYSALKSKVGLIAATPHSTPHRSTRISRPSPSLSSSCA